VTTATRSPGPAALSVDQGPVFLFSIAGCISVRRAAPRSYEDASANRDCSVSCSFAALAARIRSKYMRGSFSGSPCRTTMALADSTSASSSRSSTSSRSQCARKVARTLAAACENITISTKHLGAAIAMGNLCVRPLSGANFAASSCIAGMIIRGGYPPMLPSGLAPAVYLSTAVHPDCYAQARCGYTNVGRGLLCPHPHPHLAESTRIFIYAVSLATLQIVRCSPSMSAVLHKVDLNFVVETVELGKKVGAASNSNKFEES